MNTVVALGALKGSPGVTTTAVALAHVWPSPRDVIVAECDPQGGDLASRLNLGGGQGLLGLAGDAPGGVPTAGALHRHLQPIGPIRPIGSNWGRVESSEGHGVFAFTGHRAASQSRNPLRFLASALCDLFASADADVLVDCGRLYHESPALVFAERADHLLIVVRAMPDTVPRLAEDLSSLVSRDPLLVLIGRKSDRELRYSASEVENTLGLRVVGTIEDDPQGASALCGRPSRVRNLDRQPIITSARATVERLMQLVAK